RPKVPLFRTREGHDDSVSRMRRGFVTGAFDEFREKYLESPHALFSTADMEKLREQTAIPGTGDAAAHLLCRCMAISIFERICSNLDKARFEPPRLNARSAPWTTTDVPV